MPKKESSSKAREWERDRRERLNETFNTLNSLLPNYDPSVTRSKVEILQKAIEYISNLQKENRESVKNGKDQICWKQVRVLKLRVESLLRRIQQLAKLLHDAGISIPPELPKDGTSSFSGRPPKWSNRIRQEDAPALLEKVKEKEANKKKKRTTLNVSKKHATLKEKKRMIVVSTSATSFIDTISSTSKTKPSRVTKNKGKKSKDEGKDSRSKKELESDKLPTVTQLLGLTLNDIALPSPSISPPLLRGNRECPDNNLQSVKSNTSGTNVTVLTSNIPQVPQGYIVIPKASSLPPTSKSLLSQKPCIMMTPQTSTVSCQPNIQQQCVSLPSKTITVMNNSLPVQQPVSVIVCNTTSALENVIAPVTLKSDKVVAVTNSHLLTAPIMATGIQTCATPKLLPSQGTSISGLGPGTLILANGSILPIFSSPQPVSAAPRVLTAGSNTQIVMNTCSNIPTPVLSNQPVLLVQNKTQSTSNTVIASNIKPQRKYSLCLPKPLKRKATDSTKTTFSNKVPISALHSHSYRVSHSNVVNASTTVLRNGKKSDMTKCSKQITIKKGSGFKKGAERESKLNSKVNEKSKNSKRKSNSLINDSAQVSQSFKASETSNVLVKENANYISHINKPALLKDQENVSGLNYVNVEQRNENPSEMQQINALSNEALQSKRKQENYEDANVKSKKQLKLSHNDCTVPKSDNVLPSTSCTTTTSTVSQVSESCSSVNECDKKKAVVDNYQMCEDVCIYSTNSSKRSEDKHEFVDISKRCSVENKTIKENAFQKNMEDQPLMPTNDATAIPCKINQEPLNAIPQILNNVSDPDVTAVHTQNSHFLNNLYDSTSCNNSLGVSAISNNEEQKETVGSSYGTNASKNSEGERLNNSKIFQTFSDNQTNIAAYTTSARTTSNSELSSDVSNMEQPEMCTEKQKSVCLEEPPRVNLSVSRTQENTVSESRSNIPSCQMNCTTGFGDKTNSTVNAEKTCDSLSLEMSVEIKEMSQESVTANKSSEESSKLRSTDKYALQKEEKKNIHSDSSSELHNLEKTNKDALSEKENRSTELSSATEFSSFADSNVNGCVSGNKTCNNTGNIELGTSASSSLCLSLQHNELSNDLFASLQVPSGGQHSESISPTAAFLLAFPLVSTSKVSDIIGDSQDDVGSDSLQGTSTLLQIGNLDSEHNSEAIISRSPAFQSPSSTNKILSQSLLCPNNSDSGPEHQNLQRHHFLPSVSRSEEMITDQKTKLQNVKFSESHNSEEVDKARNKNWMPSQDSSSSAVENKSHCRSNIQGNLNSQTFTPEYHASEGQKGEIQRDSSKEKVTKQLYPFSIPKPITNNNSRVENNINILPSQPNNTSVSSFSVNQFVSSIFESPLKEPSPGTSKQNETLQSSLAPPITRSINFIDQTSNKFQDNFIPTYKNSTLSASNGTSTANSSLPLRKNVSEQGTMTENAQNSHLTTSEHSNPIKLPNIMSYSTSDCGSFPSTSQYGYMLNNTLENEKSHDTSSSVVHNSSNFSILSWTTLPLTSTTNVPDPLVTNQNDCFTAQNNAVIPFSENGYSSFSEKQSKTNCPNETLMTAGHQTYRPELKQLEQDNILPNHSICKISESLSTSNLRSTNNVLENHNLIHQYLNEQPKIQDTVGSSNVNSSITSGSQVCSQGKLPDNELQHRPPVNWMTAPDTRGTHPSGVSSNSMNNGSFSSNSSTETKTNNEVLSSKNNKFCGVSSSQNLFEIGISTSLPMYNTSNSFYPGPGVSCQTSHTNYYQSDIQTTNLMGNSNVNSKSKVSSSSSLNHISQNEIAEVHGNDIYSIPWIQKKSNCTLGCGNDVNASNFVSSLPTLIGDLALGTNYPLSGNDDLEKQTVNFNTPSSEKKNSGNHSLEAQRKHIQASKTCKNSSLNKEQNCTRSNHEFRNASSQSTFLSVSQLVNQANSCDNSSRGQAIPRVDNQSHQVAMSNKQSQPQHHQITDQSHQVQVKKHTSSSTISDKEINQKALQMIDQSSINFRLSGSNVSLPHPIRETSNKIQTIGNNNYNEGSSSGVSSLPHISTHFSVHSSTQTVTSSIASVTWQTGSAVKQHHNTKVGTAGCKTPANNYSAEALIGLNSSQITDRGSRATHDSRGSKVISVPPPVVTERFCHHQNYPPPPGNRPLQVPPPFTADSILPSNYFSSVEFQTPHQDTTTNHQSTSVSQSQHTQQRFNTFTSSTPARVSAGQTNGILYSHSEFMPTVGAAHSSHSLPPVSLSCNFLPDLGTNNSYSTGILTESNPFLFPSSTLPMTRTSSVSQNTSSGKQNSLHGLNSGRSTGISVRSNSNQVHPALPSRDKIPYSNSTLKNNNENNVTQRANVMQPNDNSGGGNTCNPPKQKTKKRTVDSVPTSSSSGHGGLMDLGYLGIPPVIGSPMLQDEGAFLNHAGGFLTGSQHTTIYSATPNTAQGPFYTTPHSHVQSSVSLSIPHSNSIAVNSGSFSTQTSRSVQLNTMVSPSIINPSVSSGTSLTNFNLSTIFPEINEKHVSNQIYDNCGPKDPSGSLLNPPLPVPSLPPPPSLPPAPAPPRAEVNSSTTHSRQPASLLLPPVTCYTQGQTSGEAPLCLPPPPPVPLHSNMNLNILNPTSQMCQMQWR